MLERLLTSKTRIKVLEFILFRKQTTHLREIARETKTPISATKREVDNLTAIGLLKKHKKKIEANKNSTILHEIEQIFIKTDYMIHPLKEALEKQNIAFAFIFGSFPQENHTPDSDIDLLIVGNISQKDALKELKPVEDKTGKEINTIVWSQKDLTEKKNTSFIQDISKKKIIMVKGKEDELRKIIG
jgi:predicted nucleotidyltransferase